MEDFGSRQSARLLQAPRYRRLRETLHSERPLANACHVGSESIQDISGEVVNVVSLALDMPYLMNNTDSSDRCLTGKRSNRKEALLHSAPTQHIGQHAQQSNPDARILLLTKERFPSWASSLTAAMVAYCRCNRFIRVFWERGVLGEEWSSIRVQSKQRFCLGTRTRAPLGRW